DFDGAYGRAKHLQMSLHPFRHLGFGSLHCTRFILEITRFAEAPLAVRVLESMSCLLGPGTALLVRAAGVSGRIYVLHDGTVSNVSPWTALLRNRPAFTPSHAQMLREGSALPPIRHPSVSRDSRWLSGAGAGKWVALTREACHAPGEFRFRRWSVD